MIYDFTQQPPRILIDEGDGHLVDRRIYDNLRKGNAIFCNTDENEQRKNGG
ncbi:MAG: hypothetical protein J6Q25_08590 [Bacteroidales bacterium]|nr:hypothetical protein [Bacteroidales bacterium]